jgi:hypothetical protein
VTFENHWGIPCYIATKRLILSQIVLSDRLSLLARPIALIYGQRVLMRKSNDFLVQALHPEFLILTDPNVTPCDRNREYGNRKKQNASSQ